MRLANITIRHKFCCAHNHNNTHVKRALVEVKEDGTGGGQGDLPAYIYIYIIYDIKKGKYTRRGTGIRRDC